MNRFLVLLKGAAMGVVEVIPGVSGGTIALIVGIYEKLLNTIKAFDAELLKHIFKLDFKYVRTRLDIGFLVSLLVGMFSGLVFGVFVITYLLEKYPVLIWGFFFGLVLASVVYIGGQVSKWNLSSILGLVAGAVLAYMITIFQPAGGSESLWFVAFSGMLAISALMLPGISGSFVLVLLGMYGYIIAQVKNLLTVFTIDALLVVLCFAVGCILGMVLFSRSVSYAFNNYRNITLATMCGIMLGSVNKIWPWRNPQKWITEEGDFVTAEHFDAAMFEGKLKIVAETNVFPHQYNSDPMTLWTIGIGLVGFGIVIFFDRYSKGQS